MSRVSRRHRCATPTSRSTPLDLDATGIGLHRGGRTILHEIDLAVPAGEFAALTGPSGWGKTSLLNVLATVETPDTGTVHYSEQPVTPHTRGAWVGRVQISHQSFGLLSLLTAAENVELALQGLPRVQGPPRARLCSDAREALDSVGLAARAELLVKELSGGEQQRVALARAVVTGPDLLFADEPTAQLDADNRERVTDLLLRLARSGVTVVIAPTTASSATAATVSSHSATASSSRASPVGVHLPQDGAVSVHPRRPVGLLGQESACMRSRYLAAS